MILNGQDALPTETAAHRLQKLNLTHYRSSKKNDDDDDDDDDDERGRHDKPNNKDYHYVLIGQYSYQFKLKKV